MTKDNKINYVEFFAKDLSVIKTFYANCFDWNFTDYGKNYSSFSNSGIDGGFEQSDKPIINGALIVIHHTNLKELQTKIVNNGGEIVVKTFSFPGGRRFQFRDPSGNELAVWTNEEE